MKTTIIDPVIIWSSQLGLYHNQAVSFVKHGYDTTSVWRWFTAAWRKKKRLEVVQTRFSMKILTSFVITSSLCEEVKWRSWKVSCLLFSISIFLFLLLFGLLFQAELQTPQVFTGGQFKDQHAPFQIREAAENDFSFCLSHKRALKKCRKTNVLFDVLSDFNFVSSLILIRNMDKVLLAIETVIWNWWFAVYFC